MDFRLIGTPADRDPEPEVLRVGSDPDYGITRTRPGWYGSSESDSDSRAVVAGGGDGRGCVYDSVDQGDGKMEDSATSPAQACLGGSVYCIRGETGGAERAT